MAFFAQAVALWPLLVLLVGLVLLAVAMNALVPARRPRLRRVVVLLALAILAAATELGMRWLGFVGSAHWLQLVANLFSAFTFVNLIAIAVFELVLPRLRVYAAPIVYELVLASGWMLAAVVVLTASGVDLTGVVAASTIAAAILTLALQATLGNVLGGVAVQFDGSIRAGDWLELENGRQGRVREVRWRHTVLETRDGDSVVVPNSSLLSMLITILGRQDGLGHPHRMSIDFLTDVGVPPDLVVRVVQEGLRHSPMENVAATPEPDCVCVDIGGHNAGFNVFQARVWIVDLRIDQPTVSRARERIHAAMRRANLSFGSPTTGMYRAGVDGEQRRAVQLRADARRMLDQVALFDGLTAEEKDHLAPKLHPSPYAPGEVITREGSTAHGLFLVGSGSARVVTTVDGGENVVAVLEPPTFFGEMSLMTGEPRSASVVALTSCECWRLDKVDFDEILKRRPTIAEGLSALLATRRLELVELRDGDGAARQATEQARILDRIRVFFGLGR